MAKLTRDESRDYYEFEAMCHEAVLAETVEDAQDWLERLCNKAELFRHENDFEKIVKYVKERICFYIWLVEDEQYPDVKIKQAWCTKAFELEDYFIPGHLDW